MVNFFTAFLYVSGCEVRYCFVIFLRVPQFSGPLYAWYNLGLVPPSSTQVAGDRFNPSIQVFCQRGRRGGGSGYSAVILVRTLIPWNSSLNSKYDPPPRNNWINICSRYTKENPIKKYRILLKYPIFDKSAKEPGYQNVGQNLGRNKMSEKEAVGLARRGVAGPGVKQ